MKKKYVAPEIYVETIYLEGSIVVGSAVVKPVNKHNQIYDEWETDTDEMKSINW